MIMNRAKLSLNKEGNILYVDFTGLYLPVEFELVIAEVEAISKNISNIKSLKLLLLTDFTNAQLTPEVFDVLIKYSRMVRYIAHKHAIVRIQSTSILKAIFRTYTGKKVYAFRLKDDVMEWFLVKKEKKSSLSGDNPRTN